jgi:hypothetical protein
LFGGLRAVAAANGLKEKNKTQKLCFVAMGHGFSCFGGLRAVAAANGLRRKEQNTETVFCCDGPWFFLFWRTSCCCGGACRRETIPGEARQKRQGEPAGATKPRLGHPPGLAFKAVRVPEMPAERGRTALDGNNQQRTPTRLWMWRAGLTFGH